MEETICLFFITDGAERVIGNFTTADRPGPMSRTEYHPIPQRKDFGNYAVIDFCSHFRFTFLSEKISPCNITGKKGIAGKYHVGLIAHISVTQHEGYALFSMSRSLQDLTLQAIPG